MGAYLDKSGSWYSKFRYKDWEGKPRQKLARGFKTEEDALAFEEDFKQVASTQAGMPFEVYAEKYLEDIRPRVRPSTFSNCERIVRLKIVPLFKESALCEISPLDVLHAQDELSMLKKDSGELYSPTYLRRINERMSTMFNHAVSNYELRESPCTSPSSKSDPPRAPR